MWHGVLFQGEHVVVEFSSELFTSPHSGGGQFPTIAGPDGSWEVEFNSAGVGHGPGNVTITGEEGPPIVATNVMGGDVYFCSGQSNMVFPVKFACVSHVVCFVQSLSVVVETFRTS